MPALTPPPEFAYLVRLTRQRPIVVTQTNAAFQAAFLETLTHHGLETLDLPDRNQALAICRSRPISLVITNACRDQRALDGLDLFRLLRSEPRTRTIRFLFTTSLTRRALQDVVGDLVVDGYIQLPAGADAVLEATVQMLHSLVSRREPDWHRA